MPFVGLHLQFKFMSYVVSYVVVFKDCCRSLVSFFLFRSSTLALRLPALAIAFLTSSHFSARCPCSPHVSHFIAPMCLKLIYRSFMMCVLGKLSAALVFVNPAYICIPPQGRGWLYSVWKMISLTFIPLYVRYSMISLVSMSSGGLHLSEYF